MTTTTSTPPPAPPVPPSISSFDPQLLKLLARHHLQQQTPSAKDLLQHAFYFNHHHHHHPPPPNTVAVSPRHHLGNGLSKLNSEIKLSPIVNTNKTDSPPSPSIRKSSTQLQQQQSKEAIAFDQWLQPPLGSIIQGPPCIQADTSSSSSSSSSSSAGATSSSSAIAGQKTETTLSSGERITCFVVGGEKRLCLPEILNTVLKDFSLQEINTACERLHIYCSRCTVEQLDILKMTQVLPMNAPSCGLITQTDAERLCANLLQMRYKGQLRSVHSSSTNQYERLYAIKVQHKCFGKCSGILYPTLYVAPHAECIQCDSCQALFSPKTFVSHGHKSEENRICHWGFNSDNWRAYLKIRSTEDNKAREELELVKEKFSSNKKRPTSDCVLSSSEKRVKLVAPPPANSDCWPSPSAALYSYGHPQVSSATFGASQHHSSMKKDNHIHHHGEYSFGACLPRPTLIPPPLPLPTETTTTTTTTSTNTAATTNNRPRPSPLRVVRSNSPPTPSNDSVLPIVNPSTNNFNDFTPDGIRQMVESTVTSPRARHQLIIYITQLQMSAYAHSSKTTTAAAQHHGESILLRRENEALRARLSKLEARTSSSNCSTSGGSKLSSFSSSTSISPPHNHRLAFYHNHQQQDSAGDSDDLDSTASSHSTSSTTAAETVVNVVEQPQPIVPTKYFDRKRRLLAAEMPSDQISPSSLVQSSIPTPKKSSPHKKACLDDIVDSLSQKAQAEQEEDDEVEGAEAEETETKEDIDEERDDDEEEIVVATSNTNNNSTPPSPTIERDEEDEDIDIDDAKLADDDH